MTVREERRVYQCDGCKLEAHTPTNINIPETWTEIQLREPTYEEAQQPEVFKGFTTPPGWASSTLHYCAGCWADGSVVLPRLAKAVEA